jgi:hypothetical protein
MTTRRTAPVVDLARPGIAPQLRGLIDSLHETIGKVTSLADVVLLVDPAGFPVTDAAASPGTAIGPSRAHVNFADAGADQCRLVVRGHAGATGSVVVLAVDETATVELCRVTLTNGTVQTATGDWTNITPTGSEQEVGLRVFGNGVLDPVIFRASLQLRTLRAGSGQPGVAG